MALATYYRVLESVKGLLEAALTMPNVSLRKAPQLYPLIATLPEVIVAPRDDLAEALELQFDNSAMIDYPVYVGYVAEARHDGESLAARLLHREEVRLALYKPLVLAAEVAETFDVDYTPAPGDPSKGTVPPTLDSTWQLFTFRAQQPRSTE